MPRSERNKRFKVFDESGLTDAERREIRQKQRAIREELKAGDQGSLEVLEAARDKNNELFAKVCFTREAVLDADNLDDIAQQYAKKAEKDVQVPRFDPIRLIQKLKQKCSGRTEAGKYFDWRKLGVESGICFHAVPERVSFLAGSLDVDVALKKKKERKKRVQHVEEEGEEVNPEKVNNNEARKDAADKLSAMEKNMKQLKSKLKKKHERTEKEGAEIDGVKFLFNPRSFTQTVENIFNFTFLIKKGEAEMSIRSRNALANGEQEGGSGLVIKPRPDMQEGDADSTQAVLAFTMKDWERLCEENFAEGEEGGLPHRTGSTLRNNNFASQE